jgi:putative heme iron utilization protein
MDSASGADYAAATPDPVATGSASAVKHLNEDHADALLVIARALGGFPDATEASCNGIDRRGIDLYVETPRGKALARVAFPAPLDESSQLRSATVELTRRARASVIVSGSKTTNPGEPVR